MKSRTLLMLLAVGAGIVAILWLKPATPPAIVAVPKAVETADKAERPVPTPDQAPNPVYRAPVPQPAPSPASEDRSASLLAAIMQALASTNLETRDFALTNLLPALVLENPFAAGRLAETNTFADVRDELLQRTAKLLATQDSTNALAWAAALQNDLERTAALTDVCLQLAETNPAEAARLRESFLAEGQSFDALEDLAQKWAEKDLAAALAWIAEHPPDVRRDQLIGRVAYVQAQTSPADAARLVVEGMTPGDAQIEAAVSVLHQWAKLDLPAATSWAERFPLGQLRDRALKELATIAGTPRPEDNP